MVVFTLLFVVFRHGELSYYIIQQSAGGGLAGGDAAVLCVDHPRFYAHHNVQHHS